MCKIFYQAELRTFELHEGKKISKVFRNSDSRKNLFVSGFFLQPEAMWKVLNFTLSDDK